MKKISAESAFLSRIPGMGRFFKINRKTHEDINNEFIDSEKSIKEKVSKGNHLDTFKVTTIVSKLVIRKFEKLNPVAKKYMEEIENDTKGDYSKRNPKILQSVNSMYRFIAKHYSARKSKVHTIFDLYLRLFNIITDKKWIDAYSMAYKLHKKGNESSTIIFMEYQAMVYSLEYLTLIIREYVENIDKGEDMQIINIKICDTYSPFITAVCKNIIPIIIKCEYTKDPKKVISEVLKIEKRNSGNLSKESEFFKIDRVEPENVSEESVLGTALLIGSISIIATLATIHGLRYIIYSLNCLTVDISKALIDQSYMLLINIERLEGELSELKESSAEYKRLIKIIEKQKKYVEIMRSISEKLYRDNVKSIDEIRNEEYEDNDLIEEVGEKDDTKINANDFDI